MNALRACLLLCAALTGCTWALRVGCPQELSTAPLRPTRDPALVNPTSHLIRARANQKLTRVLRGRTVVGGVQHEGAVELTFDDGSRIQVRTSSTRLDPAAARGHRIAKVREQGRDLLLDSEDGTILAFEVAAPGGSVMVRDRSGEMEYAG